MDRKGIVRKAGYIFMIFLAVILSACRSSYSDQPDLICLDGVGILYQGIPGVVDLQVMQLEEISENALCHHLTGGFFETPLSPVELHPGIETLYGVCSQSRFVMSHFGEVFGLTGEEEDFEELITRCSEEYHVVLFTVPKAETQYVLLANKQLISQEEFLKLAGEIQFQENSFAAEAWQQHMEYPMMRYQDMMGLEVRTSMEAETDSGVQTEADADRIKQLVEEREKMMVTPGTEAFLKVTLPGQEENLIPEGLIAVRKSEDIYELCLNNGWPVGRLEIRGEQVAVTWLLRDSRSLEKN